MSMRGFFSTALIAGILIVLVPSIVRADKFNEATNAYNAKNYELALLIFLSMAKRGNKLAQYNVATIYNLDGQAVRNLPKAVKWYRAAALQVYIPAQSNLGIMCREGQGVARDDAKAVSWFQSAADQGVNLVRLFSV